VRDKQRRPAGAASVYLSPAFVKSFLSCAPTVKSRLWLSQEIKDEEASTRDFLMSLPDTKEAAQAFVEKRTPQFKAK